MRSIYCWNGQIQDDAECMLVIKTHIANLNGLEQRFNTLHPYETPEFLVLVPESGSKAYLLWMDESLS